MGINDLNHILGQVYGKWKFNEQQGWRVEIYSIMKLTIGDLWVSIIGLPNDGYVVIKAMCPKTLCANDDGRK